MGGGDLWEQYWFAISPLDTNEWLLASLDDMGIGYTYISRNAGVNRHLFLVGYQARELSFSQVHPGIAYFVHWECWRLSTVDSAITSVFPPGEELMGLDQHPTHPWYFFLSQGSIERFDDSTNELFEVELPDSVGEGRDLLVSTDGLLLVYTQLGWYHVSLDLAHWELVGIGLPVFTGQPYLATDRLWVARQRDFYCRSPLTDSSPGERISIVPDFAVHPNPSSGMLLFDISAPMSVSVFNVLGQRVTEFTVPMSGAPASVDLSHLSAGQYFVRARSLSGPYTPTRISSFHIVK